MPGAGPRPWPDRLTERTNQVGCVVGSSLGLVLVAIAAVLIFG
ncbi:hypothetical protein [Streptomyces sp. NPDC048462]